jgi:hypothetical protein
MNGFIDQDLLDLIRCAIRAGWVSVVNDPYGDFKEYFVPLSNEDLLVLSRTMLSTSSAETVYEYVVSVGENEVATAVVSTKDKIHSPAQQVVLELFCQCAHQIVAQEMRGLLNSQVEKVYHS